MVWTIVAVSGNFLLLLGHATVAAIVVTLAALALRRLNGPSDCGSCRRSAKDRAIVNGAMLHLIRRDGGTAGGGGGDGDGGGGGCRAADQAESRRLTEVTDHRRTLIGARFSDVQVIQVLGSGCNGAVFDAVVRGVPVAAKVSVCRFARHSKRVHVRLAVCTTQWKYYSKCAMERRAHAHTRTTHPPARTRVST